REIWRRLACHPAHREMDLPRAQKQTGISTSSLLRFAEGSRGNLSVDGIDNARSNSITLKNERPVTVGSFCLVPRSKPANRCARVCELREDPGHLAGWEIRRAHFVQRRTRRS